MYLIIIPLTIAIDQITKFAVASKLAAGASKPVINNFFYVTHAVNHGAAGGDTARSYIYNHYTCNRFLSFFELLDNQSK